MEEKEKDKVDDGVDDGDDESEMVVGELDPEINEESTLSVKSDQDQVSIRDDVDEIVNGLSLYSPQFFWQLICVQIHSMVYAIDRSSVRISPLDGTNLQTSL